MALSFKRVLVIDIEATCWEKKELTPAGEESEIIEIGLAEVDLKTNTISGRESIVVRPIDSKVSEFCTKLTTLTQADVDKGISFPEALKKLKEEYSSDKIPWYSWGDYDREMFRKQCQRRQLEYPFNKTHTNLKAMYSVLMGHEKGLGMDAALQELRIPLEGTHHRGGDDANNIAKILLELKMRHSIWAAVAKYPFPVKPNVPYTPVVIERPKDCKPYMEPHPLYGEAIMCGNCGCFIGWSGMYNNYAGPIRCHCGWTVPGSGGVIC